MKPQRPPRAPRGFGALAYREAGRQRHRWLIRLSRRGGKASAGQTVDFGSRAGAGPLVSEDVTSPSSCRSCAEPWAGKPPPGREGQASLDTGCGRARRLPRPGRAGPDSAVPHAAWRDGRAVKAGCQRRCGGVGDSGRDDSDTSGLLPARTLSAGAQLEPRLGCLRAEWRGYVAVA